MLAEIEKAIIKRIKATLTYISEVDTYAGQLDALANIASDTPSVWVAFTNKEKPKQHGADRFLHAATFTIICCIRSALGVKIARYGDSNNVGAFRIMSDIAKLLEMNDLKGELAVNINIDHLRPGAMQTLHNTLLQGDAIVAFSQEWHTEFISNIAGFPMTGGAPVAEIEVDGVTVTTPIVNGETVNSPTPELKTLAADFFMQPGSSEPEVSDLTTLGETT